MPTESVEILISAKDTATGVIAQAAQAAKKADAEFKAVNRATKDAGDGFAKLARAMGGGWIAAIGSQAKEAATGVDKLAEAMKAGGAAAAVLKAGAVGLVGFLSFRVGKTLGDIAFRTRDWADAMDLASERANALARASDNAASRRRDRAWAYAEEFGGDDEKKQKDTVIRDLDAEIAAQKAKINAMLNDVRNKENVWFKSGGFKDEITKDKSRIDEEVAAVRRMEEDLAIKREMNSEAEYALRDERKAKEEAEAADIARRKRGMEFMAAQRKFWAEDLPSAMRKSWAEQDKQAKKEAEELRRRTMAFQRQDADDAWDRRTSRIEWMREQFGGKKPDVNNGPLAASESRLLSRNPGVDIAKQQLETEKRQEALLKATTAAQAAANIQLGVIAANTAAFQAININ